MKIGSSLTRILREEKAKEKGLKVRWKKNFKKENAHLLQPVYT